MTAIGLMNDPHARVPAVASSSRGTGPIARAIIHDHQFGPGYDAQHVSLHVIHGQGNGAFLVIDGHDDGEWDRHAGCGAGW